MQQANIDIPSRDILRDETAYRELVMGGGSQQVPCLRIESAEGERWLYESADIIEYLRLNPPLAGGAATGSNAP